MSRLRPWNVFKKTVYAGPKDGGRLPLATRISLARAKSQADETQMRDGASFFGNLSMLLPPAAAAWLLLLAARWRGSCPERLREIENAPGGMMLLDFLGSRTVAHLGPYQVPNFVRARLHEAPLRQLRLPLLLDHERAAALGRLEQLSQRRLAAVELAPPPAATGDQDDEHRLGDVYAVAALRAIEPLLRDLFAPAEVGASSTSAALGAAASHKATTLRVVLDVVSAVPPESRAVPPWVLSGLVSTTAAPWDYGPQAEELRATLLSEFLGSRANCAAAAALPEVCAYVQQLGTKVKADTLWPLKAYLLSGETPDLLRRCALLISRERPGSVEVPPRRDRDTPSLQTKHDLRNLWTTALLTAGWAGFRAWRGVLDVKAGLAIAQACGGALGGMAVLESLWRVEEAVVQSSWYFEDSVPMLAASAGMCLVNCAGFAWAMRFSAVVPFLVCRFGKDDLMDAYRSFEP